MFQCPDLAAFINTSATTLWDKPLSTPFISPLSSTDITHMHNSQLHIVVDRHSFQVIYDNNNHCWMLTQCELFCKYNLQRMSQPSDGRQNQCHAATPLCLWSVLLVRLRSWHEQIQGTGHPVTNSVAILVSCLHTDRIHWIVNNILWNKFMKRI